MAHLAHSTARTTAVTPAAFRMDLGRHDDHSPEAAYLSAELVSATDMEAWLPAWTDLARRSLEANVFFDPAFAMAAIRNIPREVARPQFLIVQVLNGPARTLRAVIPLNIGKLDQLLGVYRGWMHPYMTCSTPLIDRTNPVDVLTVALQWLQTFKPEATNLIMSSMDVDGAVLKALRQAAQRCNVALETLALSDRAALRLNEAGGLKGNAFSGSRAKEYRRLRRRLEEAGTLQFEIFSGKDEVREHLEAFMSLEAQGWKGKRGTALVQEAGRAAFTRNAVQTLANDKRVRLVSLTLDGRMIAGGIVLLSGRTAFFWKIAYDEEMQRFSLGNQLVLMMSEALQAAGDIDVIDSCAGHGHEMIERLWADRIVTVDVMIGINSESRHSLDREVRHEQLRRAVRSRIKQAYHRFVS